MKISKNMVAALAYELEVEGKIADKAGKEMPLEYIHGSHMLIPRFEEEVEGKEPGDKFEFTLTAAEGYGEYEPGRKINIPKSSFVVDGVLREDILTLGRTVPMLNSEGQVVSGTIAEILEDQVTMDFNHPMAGKALHFTGEVISVREASEDELKFGLHGEYKLLEEEEGHECCCHRHDGEEGQGHHCHRHDGEEGQEHHCHRHDGEEGQGHHCHRHDGEEGQGHHCHRHDGEEGQGHHCHRHDGEEGQEHHCHRHDGEEGQGQHCHRHDGEEGQGQHCHED